VEQLPRGQQHGFLAKRSMVTNLLDCLALDNYQSVTVAYIDYSKLCDMVSRTKLLHKLSHFKISGHLFKWKKDFLDNRIRTQCVRVK